MHVARFEEALSPLDWTRSLLGTIQLAISGSQLADPGDVIVGWAGEVAELGASCV